MERIERKILQVVAEPRIWGDDKGNGRAAEVGFVLETQSGEREFGEYRSTESAWSKVVERATPSVGQVFTFDAEPKKPYRGTKQWALKSYPGKPEGDYKGGGSGGGRGKGDWESAVERADRRLNDAATKVLGVAAVLVGDEGPAVDRAKALKAIVNEVADAFLVAREALAPSFPTLGAAPTPAPATAPQEAKKDTPKAAKSDTWGPAPAAFADTRPHPDGAEDGSQYGHAPNPDLHRAWEQLAELTGGPAKALIAVNRHFGRRANAEDFTLSEVMEVLGKWS